MLTRALVSALGLSSSLIFSSVAASAQSAEAQQPAAVQPRAPWASSASPRLAPPLALDEQPEAALTPRHGRAPGELVVMGLAGLGTGLVGVAAGVGIGYAAACSDTNCHGEWGALAAIGGMGIGAIAGTILFAPVGVTLVGNAYGGRGSYGASLLGATLGVGAGALIVGAGAVAESDGLVSVGIVATPLLALTGAVLGYQLSSRGSFDREHAARRRSQRATALPSVGVHPGGASVQLAGTF